MRRASELKWVDKIVQVGARGTGTAAGRSMRRPEIWRPRFSADMTFKRTGLIRSWSHCRGNKPCYLTIDCDGWMYPACCSHVADPRRSGLFPDARSDQGHPSQSRLAGLNLVEFVPERISTGLGAVTAMRIIWNFIGEVVKKR